MDIIISSKTDKPIYEQITSQIKAKIMEGGLKAGEALPSMRSLARTLRISVITVQRAYEELQRDGFIETVVGKGTFVSSLNKEFYQEERQREMEEYLEKAIDIAKSSGIPKSKIKELVDIFYGEDNE